MKTIVVLACLVAGCSNEANIDDPPALPDGGGGSSSDASVELPGTEVSVDVPASGRAFVDLDLPGAVLVAGEGASSTDWDLAFSGRDVLTNSGPSGPGSGQAFGPLDPLVFVSATPPDVPFLISDETGGALADWYVYDGASHVLYSRFHVYGVRRADRTYKLQILSYYGEIAGAPVSGVYSVRYALVESGGAGPTQLVAGIDATAGGPGGTDDAPSACLELATGTVTMLAPDSARESTAWDVCFRRSSISVNGELGGPGDVGAVDLDVAQTASETLELVEQRTPESELARFDAVDFAKLSERAHDYRGDRIISAFSDLWLDQSTDPPSLADAAWRVVSADGIRNHVLAFTGLEWSGSAPRRVTFRLKSY